MTYCRPRAGALVLACVLSIAAAFAPARAVTVSLPANAGAPPAGTATVPINISSAAGILGTDIVLTFDATVVAALSVSKTTLSASHTLTTNLSTPGVILVSLFGATPLSGSGPLLNITFRSTGAAGSRTPLHFDTLLLNEGQIPASPVDGQWCVQGAPAEARNLRVGEIAPGSPVDLLSWDPVTFAVGYNLYRGGRADLADLACFLPGVTSTSAVDDGAVPVAGSAFFYLVTAINCSQESTLGAASSGAARHAAALCP